MKVFAKNYLESLSEDKVNKNSDWSWNPSANGVNKIVACGAPTKSEIKTGVVNPDYNTDTDSPHEGYAGGMLVA